MRRSALVSCLAVTAFACADEVQGFSLTPRFQQLQVVSASPAKQQADGSWQRVCGLGASDGIITNVLFLSSQRSSMLNGQHDSDVSVRPGDDIDSREVDGKRDDDIHLTSSANVELALDCINPADTSGNACLGVLLGAAPTSASIRYAANSASRKQGHNLMLLIDMSGSMHGVGEGDGTTGSDPLDLRLAAARRLVGILNSQDRIGIVPFAESAGIVAEGQIDRMAAGQGFAFGPPDPERRNAEIDSLAGVGGGRSNLWGAVKGAYDFLRDTVHEVDGSNHIIVLSDGPDTCGGEQRKSCTTPCATADLAALRAQMERDYADLGAPKVHVHFVQFESLGYPGRDPHQVEVACITGGHYQFINSNVLPRTTPDAFQEALDTAVANVRFTLMGSWQLAVAVPAYASEVAAGDLYGLQGAVTVREASHLVVASDKTFPFGFGQGQGAPSATHWDRRPTLRKPCGGFADCGATSDPGVCRVVCSPETLTCTPDAQEKVLPELAGCLADPSTPGFCCGGICETAGTCAACSQ